MSYLNIQIQIIQMMSYFIQVELLSVLKETDVSSEDTCVLMFGSVCSSSAYDPELEWHVRIPNTNKPPYQPPQPQVSITRWIGRIGDAVHCAKHSCC